MANLTQQKAVRTVTGYNLTTAGKICEAFTNDYNITQACQYAGVSRETYYKWLKQYPAFAVNVEAAQNALGKKAKNVIASAVDGGDAATAKWYLERRDPDFKAKGELEVSPVLQESREKIKGFLDDDNDDAYAERSESAGPDVASDTEQVS